MQRATDALVWWIGGFVAAEGCFSATEIGAHRRFTFQVGLGASDTSVCETLQEALGIGRLVTYERRRAHYDDEIAFVVTRMRDLVEVIVPFMDAHLPDSYKKIQYETWREELISYWTNKARRRRPCRLDRCSLTAVAHGLCRAHLWSEMGR